MSPLSDLPLPDYPRKLLLLNSEPTEEALICERLRAETGDRYQIIKAASLDGLKEFKPDLNCHAILLDVRDEPSEASETIQWIGQLECSVALICLCKSHQQLSGYKPLFHLIDDYILADPLPPGELSTRISHAIRRRIKESELLHEQHLLTSLLENIPDWIYFKDLTSKFTKVNKAMVDHFGHEPDGMIGKTDFDLFTEEHARPAYQDEQRIIQTGKAIVGKIEKETYDDRSEKWVNTTKIPLRDNRGRIIGTMGISRDVSELKRAQDHLSEEHRLLTTVLNNVPDRIFVKDRAGRYIASNRLHLRFIGASDESEILGTTIHDHFPKAHAEKYSKEDMKIIRTGVGIINAEEKRETDDGRIIWYLTSKVPLIDERGDCVGLVGISRDVTKQKENESKLRDTIKSLHETQLQLIEAEKLKTVGRLAAGVAHEVKNPLNVVSLGAEYLGKTITEPAELAEIIHDMRRAVEKANNVIFQLLDYSSPHEIATDPKDLNAIIRQSLTMLRHAFNEARIKVITELDEGLPLVSVDSQKMDQVFINLFLNAIAAIKKNGTVTVKSSSHRMKTTGSNVSGEMTELFQVGDQIVVVEILDTGKGIERRSADKLFDPFFSTKSTGEGTGLGLSVTRNIVEMHRGMITLKNRSDNRGACATLSLPVAHD